MSLLKHDIYHGLAMTSIRLLALMLENKNFKLHAEAQRRGE